MSIITCWLGLDVSALDVDIVRGVVAQAFTILVIEHGCLEVLVTQMRLHLLWLGAAFNGQGAARVAEHVGRDGARDSSQPRISFGDQVDGLRRDRLSMRFVAGQLDKGFSCE